MSKRPFMARLAGVLSISFGCAASALGLPPGSAATKAGPATNLVSRQSAYLDSPAGGWQLDPAGSYAGYRIKERLVGIPLPHDAVGRTSVLRGTMTITDAAIAGVALTADPRTLKSDKSNRDSSVRKHVWRSCPRASFQLTKPVPLPEMAVGTPISVQAVGNLTLRCRTRKVVFPLEARWNGNSLQVVGSLPLRLADYGLVVPTYARILSVAKTAKLEVDLLWLPR